MTTLITALQQHPLYLLVATFVCGAWLGFYLAMLVSSDSDRVGPAIARTTRKGFSLAGLCVVAAVALLAGYGIYTLLRPVYAAGGLF